MPTRTRRIARRILWAVALVACAALVVGMVVLVTHVATTTQAIRDTQQNSKSTLSVIEDCTTPGGECYDRGENRTARAVADIGKVSAYAAACADAPGRQTVDEVQACVLDRLAEERDATE